MRGERIPGKGCGSCHMRGARGDSHSSGRGHPAINHSAPTTVQTQPGAACQDNVSSLRPLKISLPKIQVLNCSQSINCTHRETSPNCEVNKHRYTMTVASNRFWIKQLSSVQQQVIMKNTSKYLDKKREKVLLSSKAKGFS